MRHRLIIVLALAGCLLATVPGIAAAKRPDVVLLVFDEFPIDSLRTPAGDIDAEMFPGFAALARTSTWFPNAATVYDSTRQAVPEILDGRLPRRGLHPTAADRPNNIFDVFGRRGYRVRAIEPTSHLCRPRWCPRGTPPRYRNALHHLDSDRAGQLRHALDAIKPGDRPTFWFRHVLLPHVPWVYLPSGLRYPMPPHDSRELFTSWRGLYDPYLTTQARQRHLLQLGFVDRMVRRLIRRLKRNGMWDRTLLLVTADHGIAFDPNIANRRLVTGSLIDEIGPVPFFVKAPGQSVGSVDPALARTLDAGPTLADVLGLELRGWGGRAGRSAIGASVHGRSEVRMLNRPLSRWITVGRDEYLARRRGNRDRFAKDFAHGIFGIGPHPELIGSRLAELGTSTAAHGLSARFRSPGRTVRGGPKNHTVPARVTGIIRGSDAPSVRDLALALNGRVVAVARSVRLIHDPHERFSILFPPEQLRRGANRLRLYEVAPGLELKRLD